MPDFLKDFLSSRLSGGETVLSRLLQSFTDIDEDIPTFYRLLTEVLPADTPYSELSAMNMLIGAYMARTLSSDKAKEIEGAQAISKLLFTTPYECSKDTFNQAFADELKSMQQGRKQDSKALGKFIIELLLRPIDKDKTIVSIVSQRPYYKTPDALLRLLLHLIRGPFCDDSEIIEVLKLEDDRKNTLGHLGQPKFLSICKRLLDHDPNNAKEILNLLQLKNSIGSTVGGRIINQYGDDGIQRSTCGNTVGEYFLWLLNEILKKDKQNQNENIKEILTVLKDTGLGLVNCKSGKTRQNLLELLARLHKDDRCDPNEILTVLNTIKWTMTSKANKKDCETFLDLFEQLMNDPKCVPNNILKVMDEANKDGYTMWHNIVKDRSFDTCEKLIDVLLKVLHKNLENDPQNTDNAKIKAFTVMLKYNADITPLFTKKGNEKRLLDLLTSGAYLDPSIDKLIKPAVDRLYKHIIQLADDETKLQILENAQNKQHPLGKFFWQNSGGGGWFSATKINYFQELQKAYENLSEKFEPAAKPESAKAAEAASEPSEEKQEKAKEKPGEGTELTTFKKHR